MSTDIRKIPLSQKTKESSTTGARPIVLKDKEISRFRSLVSAPLKGLLKELPTIAKLHDPASLFLPKRPHEKFIEEEIEKRLPTQDNFVESALERGGRILPYALTGGGGIGANLARTGLSALAGQSAEELGAGPIGQTIAEIGSFSAPSLAKKIIPSGKDQKALVDVARKYGMSEEQIAPLIPGKKKQDFFSSLASKGKDTQERLKETRSGISGIYETLRTGPKSNQKLSPQDLNHFSNEMNKLGQQMPHAIRSQLKNDAADLVNQARKKGGVDIEELINFFRDISSRYNLGKTELQRFKGPIKKALSSISPEAGHDFEMANTMWQKQIQIGESLNPGQYEGLVDLGESYALAAGVATGDIELLKKLMGASLARKFAKEMLTNPRLQNISTKSLKAIQENNLPILKKLGDLAKYELEKDED